MEILYFISLGIFLTYILTILVKFGIPKSISESAYLLGKNGSIIFYVTFISFVLPLLAYWLEITNKSPSQPLVFISCAALCFTGITGRFKGDDGESTKKIHINSTIIAGILSQLWIWAAIPGSWIYSAIAFSMAFVLGYFIDGVYRPIYVYIRDKNTSRVREGLTFDNDIAQSSHSYLFWIEMALFTLAYTSIFIFGNQ